MKKLFTIIGLLFMTVLIGCTTKTTNRSDTTNQNNVSKVKLGTNESLVFSTYMASGLLSVSNTNSNLNLSSNRLSDFKMINLTTTTESTNEQALEIETELDEVNLYFNKLKVFMDNGVDSVLNITEQASTIEGYDFMITYSVEEVTYTIYYSMIQDEVTTPDETTTTVPLSNEIDDEDEEDTDKVEDEKDDEDTDKVEDEEKDEEENKFKLVGLMVIDGVNYELTGANEIENNEQKMWFETVDATKENYVRVEIKNEDGQQKFKLKNVINGVLTSAEIKFEEEDNETKVELKLNQAGEESSYKFKKEVEDGQTTYKFEYNIDGVKGEVKIKEMVDADGNVTFKYDIKEAGKHKEIDKDDPDDKSDRDDKDDEDKPEEDESEAL